MPEFKPSPGGIIEPKLPGAPTEPNPPGALPPAIGVTPKPSVLPPSVEPQPGTPAGFTKPSGSTDAKPTPTAPLSVPNTTYDVDIYEPKAGDTYETISLEFYNDRRFAQALKAFNQNAPVQGARYVNVPPIHILRKKYPTLVGGVVPVGGTGGTSSVPKWGPPGGEPARTTSNRPATFIVPQGGMTIASVAQRVGVKWNEIYDLNSQYPPNVIVPAGTELKLPANARLPQ